MLKPIAIPYLQQLVGEKVVIAENISSHLAEEVISLYS